MILRPQAFHCVQICTHSVHTYLLTHWYFAQEVNCSSFITKAVVFYCMLITTLCLVPSSLFRSLPSSSLCATWSSSFKTGSLTSTFTGLVSSCSRWTNEMNFHTNGVDETVKHAEQYHSKDYVIHAAFHSIHHGLHCIHPPFFLQ